VTGALRAWVEVRLSSKQMEEASGCPWCRAMPGPVVGDIDLYIRDVADPFAVSTSGPADSRQSVTVINYAAVTLSSCPSAKRLDVCLRDARSTPRNAHDHAKP
jgi:hypothetical protein